MGLGQSLFVVHVPAERGEEGARESPNVEVRMTNCQTVAVRECSAELLFFVVAGEEDLATKVEAVNEAQQGVGECTHRREDSESL